MHENDDPNRTKSLDNIHLAPKPPIWKALLSKLYNRKNPDCEWGVLIEEANYEQFYSPNVSHNNSRSTTREINRSIESLAITNTDFVNSYVIIYFYKLCVVNICGIVLHEGKRIGVTILCSRSFFFMLFCMVLN